MTRWRASLVLVVVLLAGTAAPAASSRAKECRRSCGAAIENCVSGGMRRGKCRTRTLRQCRREGLAACVSPTTTFVSGPTSCDCPDCGPGQICVFDEGHYNGRLYAENCRCRTPCVQRLGVPECDGVCPPGMYCGLEGATSFGCSCIENPYHFACGIYAGAPLCFGECPPATPFCTNIGGLCVCTGD